jgi:CheY-like chemotaxis protein
MAQACPKPAVLVVEDEALVRMAAVDALADSGLPSFEAGDAEEALRLLDEHSEISLVFTDINMPGEMDGLQLARKVHEARPSVELIVTSGQQRLQDRDLPDHGSFLCKPYGPSQLVALVRQKMQQVPLDS